MKDSTKLGNLGLLVDAALAKHKNTFASQAAFIGLINGIFAIVAFAFGWLSLAIIWPIIPNFTGNQTITDGIILGAFSILMLLVVAFFMAWQSAATIVICKYEGQSNAGLQATIHAVARAASPAMSVLFAQILMFVPFLVVFALVIAFNLPAMLDLAPPLLLVLYLILILLRTVSFFAVNLAVDGKYYFLSALIQSGKIVANKGFLRILVSTALLTTINLGLFVSLFNALLMLFGQFPSDFFEFFAIFYNPMGVSALLFLAYLIIVFITPKTQILSYALYSPANCPPEHVRPGLGSRSLATVLDIIISGSIFAVSFYGAAMLVSDGQFTLPQMNIIAIIIAVIAFFVVYTIYNIYFETFGGRQTPGKRVFGLIVNDQTGGDIGVIRSFVRNILRIVDAFAFVIIVFNSEHCRLGDLLSLTKVEYENEGDATDVS